MGIRIHKFLGYGLTNVKVAEDGYTIQDPRINPDSRLLRGEGIYEDYLRFLESQSPDAIEYMSSGLERSAIQGNIEEAKVPAYVYLPDRALAWAPEYGLKNVLALRPLWQRSWSRYDDTIDYIEARDIEPRVKLLRRPIYPYETYMDTRNGRRLNNWVFDWMRLRRNGVGGATLDELVEHIGYASDPGTTGLFRDHGQAKRHIAPFVPREVRDIAEWGELFTDPKVCFQLRPMLYTYWS